MRSLSCLNEAEGKGGPERCQLEEIVNMFAVPFVSWQNVYWDNLQIGWAEII